MIVSADKEMRFYDSKNLKDWNYMSSFGEGYGVQPCQFECPDMVELPVDGDLNRKKWALIVNVNPGCYFGGSATQYFTGDFDGKKFSCDSQPNVTKWLDWGKDHYATVCFSNTGERTIAVPWMSNWQYCNIVPTKQFRSANALPRELSLYTQDGEIYLSAAPVPEIKTLRKEKKEIPAFTVDNDYHIDSLWLIMMVLMNWHWKLPSGKRRLWDSASLMIKGKRWISTSIFRKRDWLWTGRKVVSWISERRVYLMK